MSDDLLTTDTLDDEIDEDPAQDAPALGAGLADRETRRRAKKLIERWRGRGTSVARAYAYELEKALE